VTRVFKILLIMLIFASQLLIKSKNGLHSMNRWLLQMKVIITEQWRQEGVQIELFVQKETQLLNLILFLTTSFYLMSRLLNYSKSIFIYNIRKNYDGILGITLNSDWNQNDPNDKNVNNQASNRALEFQLGWYLDPIIKGRYPSSMVKNVGRRLPKYESEDIHMTHFIGLNHYTSRFSYEGVSKDTPPGYLTDMNVTNRVDLLNGTMIGKLAHPSWLYVVPWGIRKLLFYISQNYKNYHIYITENGVAEKNEGRTANTLNDQHRVQYFNDYIYNIYKSKNEDNVYVMGYYIWSLMDNFEWAIGYTARFGIFYVDFENKQERANKTSVFWWKEFLESQKISFFDDWKSYVFTAGTLLILAILIVFFTVVYWVLEWAYYHFKNNENELMLHQQNFEQIEIDYDEDKDPSEKIDEVQDEKTEEEEKQLVVNKKRDNSRSNSGNYGKVIVVDEEENSRYSIRPNNWN
jgi:hypothetical protein